MTYDVEIKYENSQDTISSITIVERLDGEGRFRRRKKALEYALDKLTSIYNLAKKCDQAYYYLKPNGEAFPIFLDIVDNFGFEDKFRAEEFIKEKAKEWSQTKTMTEEEAAEARKAMEDIVKKNAEERKTIEDEQPLKKGDLEKFKGEILAEVGNLIDDKLSFIWSYIRAEKEEKRGWRPGEPVPCEDKAGGLGNPRLNGEDLLC